VNPLLYDEVLEWIPSKARVLDLGTGDGAFLERVALERGAHVEGVERDSELVSRCIERHLIVHQGDLLDGLDQYSKSSFDVVLLLGTLQELIDPPLVLKEAFRVGQKVIISYSNFAYWRARLQLLLTGRAPVTRALPSAWYRTSNTHFFSILDFESFCRDIGMRSVRTSHFSPRGPIRCCPNFLAEHAVNLLETLSGGALERYRSSSQH
jgi:methionine biosynthesis protein MetW